MKSVKIEKLNEDTISRRGIRQWPVWEKEISRFDWQYDEEEECLLIEGEVVIETDEGNYLIRKGDFVTFSKGLKCVWDVKKPVRKYYMFK